MVPYPFVLSISQIASTYNQLADHQLKVYIKSQATFIYNQPFYMHEKTFLHGRQHSSSELPIPLLDHVNSRSICKPLEPV